MNYWLIGAFCLVVFITYVRVKTYIDYQEHCIEDLEATNLRIEIQENQKLTDILNDIKAIQKEAHIWANHDTEISKIIDENLSACARRKYQLDVKKELSNQKNA